MLLQNPLILLMPIMICVCIVCCILSSFIAMKLNLFPSIFPRSKKQGEECTLGTDCEGNLAGTPETLNCCLDPIKNKKTCQMQLSDWAKVGYCPNECSNAPLGIPGGGPGTCGKYSWPRKENEPCGAHTDCVGWGPGATDVACCQGTCQRKKKDWAGIGYCPDQCVGSFGGKPGTC